MRRKEKKKKKRKKEKKKREEKKKKREKNDDDCPDEAICEEEGRLRGDITPAPLLLWFSRKKCLFLSFILKNIRTYNAL